MSNRVWMSRNRLVAVGVAAISLAFAAPTHAVEGDFVSPLSSPEGAGVGPISIAIGLFNPDSNPDLAVLNNTSPTESVSIFLGDGAGDFIPVGAAVDLPGTSPTFPTEIEAVPSLDSNSNATVDLAVGYGATNGFSVLFGDGNGGFVAAAPLATAEVHGWIEASDFNGDSEVDFAIRQSPDEVLLEMGVGNGGFTPGPNTPEIASADTRGGVAAKFHGNANPMDLAVTLPSLDSVQVLTGLGNGDFNNTPVTLGAGDFPTAIAAGDFNADGNSDIATANLSGNNSTILLGNGAGAFTQPISSPEGAGLSPSDIEAADLNGDGSLDLALANTRSGFGTVTILLGKGNGNFVESDTSPELAGGNGASMIDGPQGLAVGDLTSDGALDIATANMSTNDSTILLNQPEASTPPPGGGGSGSPTPVPTPAPAAKCPKGKKLVTVKKRGKKRKKCLKRRKKKR